MKKPPTLTKQQLARRIGQRTRLSNRVTAQVVEALIDTISAQLAAGGRIEIANFLTFDIQPHTRLVKRSERSDNEHLFTPLTETLFVLKVRPGKHLRQQLRMLARKS